MGLVHVETERLLPIGRFAISTGLTVKALRHYDEVGVLRPARVDEATGYRFYALGQIRTAAAIARLRALELPLSEVSAVLEGDPETQRATLAAHRDRLAARLDETRRLIDDLDRLIDREEDLVPESGLPELTVEEVPARTYAVVRDRVRMEDLPRVIPQHIATTHEWVAGHGGFQGAPMASVGPADESGLLDLEVGWPVDGSQTPAAPLELVTYEPTRAVVHRHVGPYERLHQTYAMLEAALAAAELRPKAPARESYATNPEEEPDAEKWVTEIVWPVD
jgi:DNA-binding transcriptional MerR regulator